jgi:uncharacterized protein (DUF427 family)
MAVQITNKPPHELRWEPCPRRLRAELGGDVVAESAAGIYVWESGRHLPIYAVPRADVADGVLRSANGTGPAHPDPVSFFTVEAGGRVLEHGAWAYDDPDLADYVAFDFKALDRWFEEAEEIAIHPRDPHHRVDAMPSKRRVRIELDGETIAESERVVTLFETGLPARHYLPPSDVRQGFLCPSETHTGCPYKGTASYWTVRTAAGEHPDLAWFYPEPYDSLSIIRGRIAFYDEKVDLYVDGELQPRPQTQWS